MSRINTRYDVAIRIHPFFSSDTIVPRFQQGLLILVFLLFAVWPVDAATIVVDSNADENGSTPTNGTCTLREAVLAANGNVAVDGCPAGEAVPIVDVIEVPRGIFALTIPESGDASGGSLDLVEDVELEGSGWSTSIVDGLGEYIRLIEIRPGVAASVSGLTFRDGGAPFAVLTEGEVTLQSCRVTANSSDGVKTLNGGSVIIDNCLIDHNGTDGVTNNPAGQASIFDTTISDNGDAGIENHAWLDTDGVSLLRNKHGIVGYGVWQIRNTTISGNGLGMGAVGAGIVVTLDGIALINNSTVTDNSAEWGSGVFVQPNAQIDIQNTLVAGNLQSVDCDIYGVLLSTGGNIDGGNSCGFTDPSDMVNVPLQDLALGPLASHGGSTKVHGLEPTSVAIDAGVSTGPIFGCLAEDQRGFPRTDGLCDVGAVEVQPGEEMTVLFLDGFETGDATGWSGTSDGR